MALGATLVAKQLDRHRWLGYVGLLIILYVAVDMGIDGWREDESRALLDYLLEQAYRPENTCRFTWAPGSLAMWDNRTGNHYALNDYHGQRRLMHRCMVQGSPWQ